MDYQIQTTKVLGNVLIAATREGVCFIAFTQDPEILVSALHSFAKKNSAKVTNVDSNKFINQAQAEINEYLASPENSPFRFSVKLHLIGPKFYKQVWIEELKISRGSISCYSNIAKKLGRPKAARAVAMANKMNPIPIIVPCHRIMGKDGSLIGYSGGSGLPTKQKLMDLENSNWKNCKFY